MPTQFDFLPPGARSAGMGTAFVAAADDATAASTNPAGLARLTRREVSAEWRFKRLVSPYLSGGRVSGQTTGMGSDTTPVPIYTNDVDDQTGISFLSVVWPFTARATVTAYHHRTAAIDNTFFNEGVFRRATFFGVTNDENRESPIGGSRAVDIQSYGGAVGYRVTDRISVGGGVSLWTFDLDASFARFGVLESFAGPVNRSQINATARQRGNDTRPTFNLGVLADLVSHVKIGAAFRRGPSFEFTQTDQVRSDPELIRDGRFKVPDVWALGAEWRPAESLRVLVDYNRVQHSQLKQDFIAFQAISSGRPEQLRIYDANELHAGAEYVWLNALVPLAFRGGVWVDPDHVVRYVPTEAHDPIDVLFQATLPGGETQLHYTGGIGVAASSWLEVNAAADVSTRTKYVTISTVVRF